MLDLFITVHHDIHKMKPRLHPYGETGGRIRIHLDDLSMSYYVAEDQRLANVIISFQKAIPRGRIDVNTQLTDGGVFCYTYLLEYEKEKSISCKSDVHSSALYFISMKTRLPRFETMMTIGNHKTSRNARL